MKNIVRPNILHCLVLSLIQITSQSNLIGRSLLVNDETMDNKVLANTPMTAVFSLTHCCLRCATKSCSGVFYHEERKLCVTRRGSETETISNSKGWKYYSKQVPTLDFGSVSFYRMFWAPTTVTDIYTYIVDYCQRQGTHLVRLESSFQHALLNQFIAYFFHVYSITNQSDRFVAIDGKQGLDFNWYHYNGDVVRYFKWRPGQPENLWWQTYGNETLLTLWNYEMNDLWNDATVYYIYHPVLFVCEEN